MTLRVQELVAYVSGLLNDQESGHEFMTWNQPLVESGVREGISIIALKKPELFIDVVPVTMRPGIRQALPDGVREDIRVVSYVSEGQERFDFTDTTAVLIKRDSGAFATCTPRSAFSAPDDRPPHGWRLRHWAWDAGDPSSIYVSAPVPNDGREYILNVAHVGSGVKDDGTTNIHDRWKPVVVSFALYRMWSVDNESDIAAKRASEYFTQTAALLGVKLTPGG